jgi:hypothetical protein
MKELGTNQERKTVGRYMRMYLQYIVLLFGHNIANLNTYVLYTIYTINYKIHIF